jgi:hypothetical protein
MRIAMLLAAAALLVATAADAQRRPDPFAAKLPPGEGRDQVIELCTGACHLADKFADRRQTAAEWRETVVSMIPRGAQLFPEEVELLSKYFAATMSK